MGTLPVLTVGRGEPGGAGGHVGEVALDWASRLADRPAKALGTLKQILIDNDDLVLTEALTNEQRLFQTLVGMEEAIATMGAIQDRFDAGESIESVYAHRDRRNGGVEPLRDKNTGDCLGAGGGALPESPSAPDRR